MRNGQTLQPGRRWEHAQSRHAKLETRRTLVEVLAPIQNDRPKALGRAARSHRDGAKAPTPRAGADRSVSVYFTPRDPQTPAHRESDARITLAVKETSFGEVGLARRSTKAPVAGSVYSALGATNDGLRGRRDTRRIRRRERRLTPTVRRRRKRDSAHPTFQRISS